MHDSSLFDSDEVYELYLEFGFKAVGIYYVILEKQANHEKPIKESVLRRQLNLTKREDTLFEKMIELGLLIRKNGEIYNENLLSETRVYVEGRKKSKESMKELRDNQRVKKNVKTNTPLTLQPNTNTITNTNTNPNTIVMDDETFEEFWTLYDMNIGKRLAFSKWLNLSANDKVEIFKRLPNYLENKPKQYRKSPERFLGQRAWEDEIIIYPTKTTEKKEKPKQKTEIIVPDDF